MSKKCSFRGLTKKMSDICIFGILEYGVRTMDIGLEICLFVCLHLVCRVYDATSLNLYLWPLALSVSFFLWIVVYTRHPFLSNKISAVTLRTSSTNKGESMSKLCIKHKVWSHWKTKC